MPANRLIAAVLACLLLVPGAGTAGAQPSPKTSPVVLDMIAKAARRGGWVQVILRDKRVISGIVVGSEEETFTLRRDDTGMKETIAYSQVKKVRGCATPAIVKIAAGIGATVGLIYLVTKVAIPRT